MEYDTQKILDLNSTELLEKAKELTDFVPKGNVFKVKDLFPGILWKQIAKGSRLSLGILYFDWANSSQSKNVVSDAGKTKSNQQRYIKN